MVEIAINEVVSQILAVLRETFEGPAESWSYFTDHGPDSGYFGTLQRISAVEASRSIGGSTIAAHIHHVIFALNEASGWISGDRSPRDWKESWTVETVDEREWAELIDRLRKGYSDFQAAIVTGAANSVENMGATAGALAHMAFHFGAVRQKFRLL